MQDKYTIECDDEDDNALKRINDWQKWADVLLC